MKVLHLPTNVASQISVTVRALRQIGVDARGLVYGANRRGDPAGLDHFEPISRRRHPFRAAVRTARWWRMMSAAMRWADVIHWHFNNSTLPLGADLRYAARLDKVRVVEFWGSDVRNPRITAEDNPYAWQMYADEPDNGRRRETRSYRTQRRFSRYGFNCILPGEELRPHLVEGLFRSVWMTRSRVLLAEHEPCYPDPAAATRPLIVHSASSTIRKGTDAVLAAIERLRETCPGGFEFKLIHGATHGQSLELVRRCDLFIDQFAAGAYGLAAVEAMALGKPVVGHIMPALREQLPTDLPIVDATRENLAEVIGGLLADGPRRARLGRQGRAFAERHHDALRIAQELVNHYEKLLETAGAGR